MMNLAKFKTVLLTTALSASMLGVVGGALTANAATSASDNQTQMTQKRQHGKGENFEQRLQKMQVNAQAAANATISASQAVTLVQKQNPNARIIGVHYHDGSSRPNKNNANATNNANDKIVGYRVMAIGANGQPQMYIVNATNGQVTQQAMPNRANKPNNDNRPNKQPPALPTTSISLERAMQLAASKVGGEAIGANLGGRMGGHKGGKMGGHHGGRDGQGNPNMQPKTSNTAAPNAAQNQPPKTPSYQVDVVKGQTVYHVKVNAQTGEVSDAKSLDDIKNHAPNR